MKIILADDHPLILEGLEKAIQVEIPTAEIWSCTSKPELFRLLEAEPISVLIQDVKFGNDDARDFLSSLIEKYQSLKIIALSSLTDAASIQSVLKTGIHGYVLKSESTTELLQGIRSVLENKIFLSAGVASSLSKFIQTEKPVEEIHLTLREHEVLREILAEKSTREIAQTLFISEKTVEHHRANLFTKLEVKNVTGLVKKAIALGFLKY